MPPAGTDPAPTDLPSGAQHIPAAPDRWISFVDADGHLWFEEYPLPDGGVNLVLNGHVFAILALHQADGLWPGRGYGPLVLGGAPPRPPGLTA